MILVTGGHGVLGQATVRALLATGEKPIVMDDRPPMDDSTASWIETPPGDDAAWNGILAEVTGVLHLAWRGTPASSLRDPTPTKRSVEASREIIDRALAAGVARFIFASSGGSVYGEPAVHPTPEDSPLAPMNPYARGKVEVEQYLADQCEERGAAHHALRISNLYGPLQARRALQGLIPIMLRNALEGRPTTMWSHPKTTRDFIHHDDVAAAIIASLGRDDRCGPINIGSGVGTRIQDLPDLIKDCTDILPLLEWSPAGGKDVVISRLDIRRAKDWMGWAPKVPLNVGLRQVAEATQTALNKHTNVRS